MHSYQLEFLELALEYRVLRFGAFTLKSGRVSPYFFNAGLFDSGRALACLGRCYAQAIVDSSIEYDMLFGPAYKGIPLAAVTAAALAEHHAQDVPYAFNRKEAKEHGEGGAIVGAPLKGKVLILDDVITAGTAIREAVAIIAREGAKLAGVVVALDRQERGTGELSAVQDVQKSLEIPVISLITLENLIDFLKSKENQETKLEALREYRSQYGVL